MSACCSASRRNEQWPTLTTRRRWRAATPGGDWGVPYTWLPPRADDVARQPGRITLRRRPNEQWPTLTTRRRWRAATPGGYWGVPYTWLPRRANDVARNLVRLRCSRR